MATGQHGNHATYITLIWHIYNNNIIIGSGKEQVVVTAIKSDVTHWEQYIVTKHIIILIVT